MSISVAQGFRAFGRLMVSGPDALRKAKHVAEVFWQIAGGRDRYADTCTQLLDWDSCHPSVTGGEPGEVLLQVAARDDDERKLARDFAPQLVPKVLSTVPGITYLADQGRPRPSDVVAYWPALIARGRVEVEVEHQMIPSRRDMRRASRSETANAASDSPSETSTSFHARASAPGVCPWA